MNVVKMITTKKDFAKIINLYKLKRGVEVGVAEGNFSNLLLAKSNLDILYSIDCWLKFPKEVYQDKRNDSQFRINLRYFHTVLRLSKYKERSVIFRMKSEDAVKMFKDGELDFVYLDANHHYESIMKDLELWYPKVKKGGILAGHDYMDFDNGITKVEVKRAVDKFVELNGIRTYQLQKTCVDKYPSWWISK